MITYIFINCFLCAKFLLPVSAKIPLYGEYEVIRKITLQEAKTELALWAGSVYTEDNIIIDSATHTIVEGEPKVKLKNNSEPDRCIGPNDPRFSEVVKSLKQINDETNPWIIWMRVEFVTERIDLLQLWHIEKKPSIKKFVPGEYYLMGYSYCESKTLRVLVRPIKIVSIESSSREIDTLKIKFGAGISVRHSDHNFGFFGFLNASYHFRLKVSEGVLAYVYEGTVRMNKLPELKFCLAIKNNRRDILEFKAAVGNEKTSAMFQLL